MNKYYLVLPFLFVSGAAFAVPETGFLENTAQNISDFSTGISYLPDMLTRLLSKMILYIMMWKIESMIFMYSVAYDVGSQLMIDLNITSMVNAAFANIPPSIGHFLNIFEVPNCVTFLFECYSTRFVLAFMGVK